MKYKKLLPIVSILVIVIFGAAKLTTASQSDDVEACGCDDCKQQEHGDGDHEGHDHAEHDADDESHDDHDHAGHDADDESHDDHDHAGHDVDDESHGDHDHAEHDTDDDSHDGHDHAEHDADDDSHDDHDHAEHDADGDSHDGHDHAEHDADDDSHDGHDHAADDADGDSHDGHDHAADNADDDSHDGHDHAEHDADGDSHDGHDHAEHDADGDSHDGHDHAEHDAEDDSHGDHDHAEHDADDDSHDGHDHAADDADGDSHDGHDHAADNADDDSHDGHDHGEESLVVEMSKADMKKYGIEVSRAGAGELEVQVRVLGEIAMNTDRMAHIVPRVSGIVREVKKKLGDQVKKGEVIAWLESTELGGAKLDFLAKQAEMFCCSMDLTRAQEVNDNTGKLLEVLKDSPSLEELRKLNGSAMGMNRSLLVSAYSELVFAREKYLREKELHDKKISSDEDFLMAQSAFKKAEAQYEATADSVGYEVQYNLMETKRAQRMREIELQAAQQRLFIFGLDQADMQQLALLAQIENPHDQEAGQCSDPNCKECLAKAKAAAEGIAMIEFDMDKASEKMAWYPVRAPFDGTVISKHITLGEMVGVESDIFIIADLSSVWADLRIYQKDAALIKKGQKVVITGKSAMPETVGVIDYIEPVINEKTRTALARVVLDNASGRLRPGTFITADVVVDKSNAKLVVDKDIVQNVDDCSCVFVQNDHGFELREVTTGQSNGRHIEITSGLKAGETIVTKNSFRLKAELTKGAGGAHAGHSH